MPSAPRPSFLRRFSRATGSRGIDLADMGTAIALEHVLDEPPLAPGEFARPPRAPAGAGWRRWFARRYRG